MDREAIRALNRERVRKHRALHAVVKEPVGHRFLRRFNKSTSEDNSSVNPLESQDDDSESESSRPETTHNSETIETEDVDRKPHIEEISVQTGPGFDFDEFVTTFKLKSSPTSSVNSSHSWKQYVEQPPPTVPPAEEQVRQRLLATTDFSQQTAIPDIATATGASVLQLILEGIQKLTSQQQHLAMEVNRMSDLIEGFTTPPTQPKREVFEVKYGLRLPYQTFQDFLKFDETLARDDTFRAAFIFSVLHKYDPKKTITKNVTAILRKYMTRDIALQYTVQKPVPGKSLFKETALSACLLEMIDTLSEDKVIPSVPDTEYLANLGAVISNAKDWGVSREKRRAPKRPRT